MSSLLLASSKVMSGITTPRRQRLDPDLLVGVLPLGVQEAVDVGVVGVQVHRAGTLTRTELVGVGERVLQQLHDRDDARALVLDVLDRCAVLANVAEQQRDSAATLGQLQRGVDRAADRLHVVLDAQQEAVVHDGAADRVRVRALDVEVVHLLRNFLRRARSRTPYTWRPCTTWYVVRDVPFCPT